jgi:AcrR family transcriptional regulator
VFAARGYHGATMRTIAREAKVDAALIHHFFGSKDGFFVAAVQDALHPEDILGEALGPGDGTLGERLVRSFLRVWGDPGGRDSMVALIRSAFSYTRAVDLLTELVTDRLARQVVEASCVTHVDLRARLVSAQLIGVALVRHVAGVEPIASADLETVVAYAGAAVDKILAENLDPAAFADVQLDAPGS